VCRPKVLLYDSSLSQIRNIDSRIVFTLKHSSPPSPTASAAVKTIADKSEGRGNIPAYRQAGSTTAPGDWRKSAGCW